MSHDAIVMLKDDHKQIKKAFREFENAGENATVAKGKIVKQIMQHDGSPYFASRVVEIAKSEGRLPFDNEYLASNYKSLLKPMREFVDGKLLPSLKEHAGDEKKFKDAEGTWPDYPQTIQELSQKYNLQPPWHILPEPEKYRWDNYRYLKRRTPGPEVPKD